MNALDPLQTGGIAGLVIGVIVTLVRIIEKLVNRKRNGDGPLSKHAYELRTQACQIHQDRQEQLSEEMIGAIRDQTESLRQALHKGFNIEDTGVGRMPRR